MSDIQLTKSQGKQQHGMHVIRSCSLKLLQIFVSSWSKANDFFTDNFSSFELEGITKHLMTGPRENSEFCFPLTSMFSSASPQGNIEGLMETKLTVSL